MRFSCCFIVLYTVFESMDTAYGFLHKQRNHLQKWRYDGAKRWQKASMWDGIGKLITIKTLTTDVFKLNEHKFLMRWLKFCYDLLMVVGWHRGKSVLFTDDNNGFLFMMVMWTLVNWNCNITWLFSVNINRIKSPVKEPKKGESSSTQSKCKSSPRHRKWKNISD